MLDMERIPTKIAKQFHGHFSDFEQFFRQKTVNLKKTSKFNCIHFVCIHFCPVHIQYILLTQFSNFKISAGTDNTITGENARELPIEY